MAEAADPNVLEALQDIVTCQICLNSFEGRDPRSLSCLHSFCFDCIRKVYLTSRTSSNFVDGIITCPLCNTDKVLPSGGIDRLPRYFQANQVQDIISGIERLQRQDSSSDNLQTCNSCKERECTYYCFQCTRTACDQCQRRHERNHRFRHHVSVPVTKDAVSGFQCSDHSEMIEAFCAECFMSVCKSCQTMSHSEHRIMDFTLSSQAPDLSSEVRGIQTELEQGILTIKNHSDTFNDHLNSVRSQIVEHTKASIEELKRQESILLQTLQGSAAAGLQFLDETKCDFVDSSSRLRVLSSNLSSLQRPIHECPNITLSNVRMLFEDLKRKLPEFSHDTFQFTKNTSKAVLGIVTKNGSEELRSAARETKKTGSMLSGVSGTHYPTPTFAESMVPKTSFSSQAAREHTDNHGRMLRRASNQSRPLRQDVGDADQQKKTNQEEVVSGNSSSKRASTLMMWYTNTLPDIMAIACTDSGDTIAVRSAYGVVYNSFGKDIGNVLIPPRNHEACGVSPGESSQLGVLYCDKTHTIEKDWRRRPSSQVQIYSTDYIKHHSFKVDFVSKALTLTKDDSVIVVPERSTLIYKFSVNGDVIWHKDLKHPCNLLAVDTNNRLFVATKEKVHVYNPTILKLLTIPRDLDGDRLRRLDIRAICVSSGNKLLLADGLSQSIMLFGADGYHVREIMPLLGQVVDIALHRDTLLTIAVRDGSKFTLQQHKLSL